MGCSRLWSVFLSMPAGMLKRASGWMIFPRVLRVLRVARSRAGDFVEFGLRTGISDEFWLKRREPGGERFLDFY